MKFFLEREAGPGDIRKLLSLTAPNSKAGVHTYKTNVYEFEIDHDRQTATLIYTLRYPEEPDELYELEQFQKILQTFSKR
ncbi:MAG: hypothetical protein AAF441_19715 [Pseudomonadota bacterium]